MANKATAFVAASHQYISLPNPFTQLISGSNRALPFSISAWINPSVNATSNKNIVALASLAATPNALRIGLDPVTGYFVQLYGGSTVASQAATLNVWTHVVGTYDGLTLSLYINGSLASTSSPLNNLNLFATAQTIGNPDTGVYLQCSMASVRVYNYALKPGIVLDLSRLERTTTSVLIYSSL